MLPSVSLSIGTLEVVGKGRITMFAFVLRKVLRGLLEPFILRDPSTWSKADHARQVGDATGENL